MDINNSLNDVVIELKTIKIISGRKMVWYQKFRNF